MDALHYQNYDSRLLIVEPRSQRIRKPLRGGISLSFGLGVDGLLGVVDNKQVAAKPGQRTGDRRAFPVPTVRREDFVIHTSCDMHIRERRWNHADSTIDRIRSSLFLSVSSTATRRLKS